MWENLKEQEAEEAEDRSRCRRRRAGGGGKAGNEREFCAGYSHCRRRRGRPANYHSFAALSLPSSFGVSPAAAALSLDELIMQQKTPKPKAKRRWQQSYMSLRVPQSGFAFRFSF